MSGDKKNYKKYIVFILTLDGLVKKTRSELAAVRSPQFEKECTRTPHGVLKSKKTTRLSARSHNELGSDGGWGVWLSAIQNIHILTLLHKIKCAMSIHLRCQKMVTVSPLTPEVKHRRDGHTYFTREKTGAWRHFGNGTDKFPADPAARTASWVTAAPRRTEH